MIDSMRAPAVRRRIAAWAPVLASFFWLQALQQVLAIAAGLLLVRRLPLEAFALYTVAIAVQTTMVILADSGVSHSLLARGGAVVDDRRRFTAVLNTAARLRRGLELLTLAAGLPLLVLAMRSYGVSWADCLFAGAAVALALHATVQQSLYGTVLNLQLRPRDAQVPAVMAGLLRLAATIAALALTAAWTPFLWIGAIALYAQAAWTRVRAAPHLDAIDEVSRDDRDAMMLAFRNQLLGGLYFALQPQITVWILTVFGTTARVAEVGALGRLALAFALVSSAFSSLALPRFARYREPRRIRRAYAGLIGLTAGVGALALAFTWTYPEPLLMVLGAKYVHLQREVVWMVAASSLALVASAIFLLNTARGWVRGVWLGVPATMGAQVLLLFIVDVSTVRGAILIQACAFAAPLLINVVIALRGMRQMDVVG